MKIVRNDWWITPVWEIETNFDTKFNNDLLREANSSDHINVWNNNTPAINKLKEYTLKLVTELASPYISQNFRDFEFWHTNGWINYLSPGEHLPIHGHGGPKIALTYYIKAKPNSGDLLLIDPRNGCDWDNGTDGINGTKFKRIKPVESKIVFFPGFLLHTIEPNISDETRVSLSTNMGTFDGDNVTKKLYDSLVQNR
jgi:uncharacterized protein (TIGR02466 family)